MWKPTFKFTRGPMRDQVTSERMNHILDGVKMAQPSASGHVGMTINQTSDGWVAKVLSQKGGAGTGKSFRVSAIYNTVTEVWEGYVSSGTIIETSEGFIPVLWAGSNSDVAFTGSFEIQNTDTAFTLTNNDVNFAYIKITTNKSVVISPVGTGGYAFYRNVTNMGVEFSTSELTYTNPSGNIFVYYLPVGHVGLASGIISSVGVRSYIEQTPIFECHPSGSDLDLVGLPDGSAGDVMIHNGTAWLGLSRPSLGSWSFICDPSTRLPVWSPSHPFAVTHDSGLDVDVAGGFVRIFGEGTETEITVADTPLTLGESATNRIGLRLTIASVILDGTAAMSFYPGTGGASINWDGDQILTYGYTISAASIVSSTSALSDTFAGAPGETTGTVYVYIDIAEVVTVVSTVTSISQKLKVYYYSLLSAFTWPDLGIE
jgi:hypothetical protein